MTVRLVPATESDVPLIRDLATRIWHAAYAELLTVEQREYMLQWMYAPHRLAGQIRRGVTYQLALAGGGPVGFLAWERLPETTTAHLHKLYLLPEWHGFGLGQQVLREVCAAAIAAGCLQIELRVNKGNLRAQKAYLRAGFRRVESIVTDIGCGFVMDDFVLRRTLARDASDGGGPASRAH